MELEAIRAFRLPVTEQAYTWRDMVLYALGLGYGSDPLDEGQLPFVYERRGPLVVPSICNVLGHPGFWLDKPELAIDWMKVLHAEQSFKTHRLLPPQGTVEARYEITSVEDKGAAKGAILTLEKQLFDKQTAELCYTVNSALFLRGDGGQGGFGSPPAPPTPVPDGEPDQTIVLATLPQSALLYRLNGDVNPLHADPQVATKAGYRQPILHGLATMGVASRALLEAVCGQDPSRLREMHVRFSQPVYPGETIQTEIFGSGGTRRFRCRVIERDLIVLDRGTVVIAN